MISSVINKYSPEIGYLALVSYALALAVAAFSGISFYFGPIWAVVGMLAILLIRFSLPIVILAFIGAFNAWEWHWLAALALVTPGIVFLRGRVLRAAKDEILSRWASLKLNWPGGAH